MKILWSKSFPCSTKTVLLVVGLVLLGLSCGAARDQKHHHRSHHHHHEKDVHSTPSHQASGILSGNGTIPVGKRANHGVERHFDPSTIELQDENMATKNEACLHVNCPSGRICSVSSIVRGAVCRCPDESYCRRQGGRRFCGSDGHFYDNACLLDRQACLTGEDIIGIRDTILCESTPRRSMPTMQNKDDDETCLHVHCPSGRICSVNSSTGLGAVCRCPDESHCHRQGGRRVCGSDGHFYDNDCLLDRQACLTGEDIIGIRDIILCESTPSRSMPRMQKKDDDEEACLHMHCPSGRICSVNSSAGLGAVCRCPDASHCQRQDGNGGSVCALNGRFYDNQCLRRRQACLAGDGGIEPGVHDVGVRCEMQMLRMMHGHMRRMQRRRLMKKQRRMWAYKLDRRAASDDSHSSVAKRRRHADGDQRTGKRHHPSPSRPSPSHPSLPSASHLSPSHPPASHLSPSHASASHLSPSHASASHLSPSHPSQSSPSHPSPSRPSSRRRNDNQPPVNDDEAVKHQFHDEPSRKSGLKEEERKNVKRSGQNRRRNTEKVEEKKRLICSREDLEKTVKGWMRQQCIRVGNKDCDNSTEWHQATANDLFTDLDFNSDLSLELVELNVGDEIAAGDSVHRLSKKVCHLQDLMTFYDLNQDALLSLAEFYSALGILEKEVQASKTTIVAGTSLELKCISLNGSGIIWKRNGRTLGEIYNDDIKVLADGSLYVHELTLSHSGNYSCVDRVNQNVIRSHVVQVQVSPIVRVSPLTQFHTSGSTSTLRCHSEGVPHPRLSWDFNESPVPSQSDHHLLLHRNHTLLIKDSQYLKDTGAFKCKARNAVGTSQDIATVFVEKSDVPKYGRAEDPYELFLIFHDNGYSVHEPSHCHIQHVVSGTFDAFKFRPDTANDNPVQSLCEPNRTCSWGDAINVRNKFIYVSQPDLNRIVVIEVRDRFNPIEIIAMDKMPVQVDYIDHLDEVWVQCWNQSQRDGASKTSVIIRQASSDIQHHTVHTQPLRNSFAPFGAMFLPPNSALNHHFRYGYAIDSTNATTYKIDLVAMKVARVVNIGCNPISMAFVALGGKVVVNCGSQTPGVVVLDYLMDEVLETLNVTGDPYVSPDSRFLVMVDNAQRKISVYSVSDEGTVEHSFNVNPELMVSDVAFQASDNGYAFFASSADKNSVLFVDLSTGLVETVEGVGEAPHGKQWPWSQVNRVIVAGGMFSNYLMSPSSESVVVLDARRRHLQCEWQEMTSHANVIVWTEVSKL